MYKIHDVPSGPLLRFVLLPSLVALCFLASGWLTPETAHAQLHRFERDQAPYAPDYRDFWEDHWRWPGRFERYPHDRFEAQDYFPADKYGWNRIYEGAWFHNNYYPSGYYTPHYDDRDLGTQGNVRTAPLDVYFRDEYWQ